MTDVYSTPEYAVGIASIRANPDDDQIRLEVADFLEERGEHDRAAFIRLQVELFRMEEASGGKLPVKVVKGGLSGSGERSKLATLSVDEANHNCEVGNVVDLPQYPNDIYGKGWQLINIIDWQGILDVGSRYDYELFQAPPCPDRDRWRELKRAEGELWKRATFRELWFNVTDLHFNLTRDFSRGFLHSIRIRGADWVTHAEAILRRNPVREVTIVGVGLTMTSYSAGDHFEMCWPRGDAEKKWPGIAFTFEPESTGLSWTTLGSAAEAVRMRLAEGLGIPARLFDGGPVYGNPVPLIRPDSIL